MVTLSIIKADVGSIGGHIAPSKKLLEAIRRHVAKEINGLISDFYLGVTGDDIAILMAHDRGVGDVEIHRMTWDAFQEGTEAAQSQGLYGAGQDLLVESFSGNVKGAGPAVAEMEFDERPNEPFVMFLADKTEPGAYNLPLYLAFADPMNTAGLLLSPEILKGFTFRIQDVNYVEGDRLIDLNAPDDLYLLAALLRDNDR
jgi:fructose 1,6-bisphosphate aldolase/phosphatase